MPVMLRARTRRGGSTVRPVHSADEAERLLRSGWIREARLEAEGEDFPVGGKRKLDGRWIWWFDDDAFAEPAP